MIDFIATLIATCVGLLAVFICIMMFAKFIVWLGSLKNHMVGTTLQMLVLIIMFVSIIGIWL